MKNIQEERPLLILSCHLLLWAAYYNKVSMSALRQAIFYLDCPAERVFQDYGDLAYLIDVLPNQEAAISTHRLVRDAVASAVADGRAAYRESSDLDPELLNTLLARNCRDIIPPLHGGLHTQEEVVVAALGMKLPYDVVWEGLLNQLKANVLV